MMLDVPNYHLVPFNFALICIIVAFDLYFWWLFC